jgi:hypothetical protein
MTALHSQVRFHFIVLVLPSDIGTASVDMGQVNIPIPEGRIRDFCRRWKIAELSVFGSVLREDFRPVWSLSDEFGKITGIVAALVRARRF